MPSARTSPAGVMQLDIFSATTPEVADLRKTSVPELIEAVTKVGTAQQWLALTLSQVLELWDCLYTDFIAVLDGPIHHAKSFCKEHEQQTGKGGVMARKFYQREYERLVKAQHQLRATVEHLFCDNFLSVFEVGKNLLRAKGLSADEAEDSNEFFNEVIQRPASTDLMKPMSLLMKDLAQEYLSLQ